MGGPGTAYRSKPLISLDHGAALRLVSNRPFSADLAIITGKAGASFCGVRDYSLVLVESLRKAGLVVELVEFGKAPMLQPGLAAMKLLRRCRLIHVQYPTIAFGWSLLPHVLAAAYRCRAIVTLHEYLNAAALRKLSCLLFVPVGHIIFPSPEDRVEFCAAYPVTYGKTSTIPLGSNIPPSEPLATTDRTVCYFGLIAPGKGLESYIAFVEEATRHRGGHDFEVVGSVPLKQQRYAEYLRQRAQALPISWCLNLPPHKVARRLSKAFCAYLPFPDGASARRGSLLAALSAGLPVITTHGPHVPNDLRQVTLFADGPEQAALILGRLASDRSLRQHLAAAGRRYAARFSWDIIALEHVKVYERLLAEIAPASGR